MKNSTSITSVKVDKALYEAFKRGNLKTRFYLQDLVQRGMYLYMHDPEFKKRIVDFSIPVLSQDIVEIPTSPSADIADSPISEVIVENIQDVPETTSDIIPPVVELVSSDIISAEVIVDSPVTEPALELTAPENIV